MSNLKVNSLPDIIQRNLRIVNYIQTISDIYSRVPHLGRAIDACRIPRDDYAGVIGALSDAINFDYRYFFDPLQIFSWAERYKISEKEVQRTFVLAVQIAAYLNIEK